MKTRDVSHCVSSLLRKLAMLAPMKKIAKFLEELRHAQFTRSTIPSMLFGSRESRAEGGQRDVNKQ